MKPRKPKASKVIKQREKVAGICRQIERERQRHSNTRMSIALQRDAVGGIIDLALRTSTLSKLRYEEMDDHQRHKSKMAELERRLRDVR